MYTLHYARSSPFSRLVFSHRVKRYTGDTECGGRNCEIHWVGKESVCKCATHLCNEWVRVLTKVVNKLISRGAGTQRACSPLSLCFRSFRSAVKHEDSLFGEGFGVVSAPLAALKATAQIMSASKQVSHAVLLPLLRQTGSRKSHISTCKQSMSVCTLQEVNLTIA